MLRSSTSSSDSGSGSGGPPSEPGTGPFASWPRGLRPGRGWWWMAAFLLALRLAVTPLLDLPRVDRSDDLNDFLAVEAHRARAPGHAPEVLLLGSSRTMYAFDPSSMAARLSLPEGGVRLLAIPGSTPWDARVLLERNPQLFEHARVAVLDVQPYMFNDNYEHAVPGRFASLAGLSEALSLPGEARLHAVGQWLWPVDALRRPLRAWLQLVQTVAAGEPLLDASLGLPLWYPDHPLHAGSDEALAKALGQPKFGAKGWSDVTFDRFVFSQRQKDHLHALVRELRAHGVQVIVHHPPMHTGFYARTDESPAARAALDEYFALVDSLREDGAVVVVWRTPEEIGFSSEELPDYGHFPRRMALRYGELMAERICRESWLECR